MSSETLIKSPSEDVRQILINNFNYDGKKIKVEMEPAEEAGIFTVYTILTEEYDTKFAIDNVLIQIRSKFKDMNEGFGKLKQIEKLLTYSNEDFVNDAGDNYKVGNTHTPTMKLEYDNKKHWIHYFQFYFYKIICSDAGNRKI